MVEVTWLGHACFLLKDKTKSVMFDPFRGIGLPEPKVKADIVLCSHSHRDHNNIKAVSHEKSVVLEGFVGEKQINDLSIKGVATFHDEAQGHKRGSNSVYAVKLDGLSFCHLGDLGHELSPSQIAEIMPVDVLFIPIGGLFTIGPAKARRVMEPLKPKITIPMHYRVKGMPLMFFALKTVKNFIREDDNVVWLSGPSFTVNRPSLPNEERIFVPMLG